MSKKILLVDDDPVLSEALVLLLEAEGYAVSRKGDGKEIVDQICKIQPKIVILDYMLPRENGIEILRKIRRSANGFSQLPVIMISASVNIRGQARENGANIFLAKPFEVENLLEAVSNLLEDK